MLEEIGQSELVKRLIRDGLRGKGAGTPEQRVNEKAGSANDGAHRQGTQGEREEKPLHADEPSPARQNRPALRVVNGKCEPTRPQSERLPPLGVGSHLTLIIGGKL
ncbi:hypothetical protein [Devosia epidermidihirudinis]|uniref:hypothetical protein n=1 Tax=Devosia epidermidihirudinis TaxID=1293439 RepID=UPI0012E3F3EC|nr:hypothetical protein [Devosia epidermidihirudinis]